MHECELNVYISVFAFIHVTQTNNLYTGRCTLIFCLQVNWEFGKYVQYQIKAMESKDHSIKKTIYSQEF